MNSQKFFGPFSTASYKARRDKLIQNLSKEDDDFVCFFWSGSELVRNHDSHFPFRAHSDFLYLTGFSEPETLLILKYKAGKKHTVLGLRPRDLSPERGSEIWEGERLGVERAPKALGLDDAFDIHQIEKIILAALEDSRTVYWNLGIFSEWDQKFVNLIGKVTLKNRGIPKIHAVKDWRPALHELRKKKSAEEIELMRQSGNVASHGHIRAMAMTRPGHFEYQVAAEVEREFKRLGALHVAYESIVATGNNACTLHYRENKAQTKKGEILLIDAGAELHGYASDITRCFPVSGKFSKDQLAVYEAVLEAQLAATHAVKAGVSFMKPHQEAVKSLADSIRYLGLVKNMSSQNIIKKGLWKKFMPHGTSHWLGMDVHDSGRYRLLDRPMEDVPLIEGSVITVEPGLYFRNDDSSIPNRYKGIGIRIEDDVHVTKRGPDVLTALCPKTVEAVEAACGPKL